MYTTIKFEKLMSKYHQNILDGKDYLLINRNDEFIDNTTITQGIYYEGKLINKEYKVKSMKTEDGNYYIEDIYEIVSKLNKNINVSEMKYDVKEIINMNNLQDVVLKENDIILLPEHNLYFLSKKLDNNSVFDIKEYIYTFIFNNGFKLDVLIDLILNQVNKTNNYKNNDDGINHLFGTFKVEDIKKIYFDICSNLKNREDKEEISHYKSKSVEQTDFIINYDVLKDKEEFKNCNDIKSYLKTLRAYKASLKKKALSDLNDTLIINYILSHENYSIEDFAEILKTSESKIYKLIKEKNINIKECDKNKNKIKINYDVMLLHGLKPSIQSLVEKCEISLNSVKKYIKDLNLEIFSHTEYKSSLDKIQKDNKVIVENVEKIKIKITDDDFNFWDMSDNDLSKKQLEELIDNVDEAIRNEYKNDKNKEKINSEDIFKRVYEKIKSHYSIEKIYNRISKESSLKTLDELTNINKYNNEINRDCYGMEEDFDLGDDMFGEE